MGVDTDRMVRQDLLETFRECICIFCEDLIVPMDALQMPCGHVFCSDCITKSVTGSRPRCPNDAKPVTRAQLRPFRDANPALYRMLGRIAVKCARYKEMCTWQGDLSDVAEHEKQCSGLTHCKCCDESRKRYAELQTRVAIAERRSAEAEEQAKRTRRAMLDTSAAADELKQQLSFLEGHMQEEDKERKREEKQEAHLYTVVKVARDEDMREQIGNSIHFDLVDHEKVHGFHVQKKLPFNQFKDLVANELGVPVQGQRFWLWTKRQNQTYRPHRPLTFDEELQTVGQLKEETGNSPTAELKLYLEGHPVSKDNPVPVPLPERGKDDILLFFKLYDPKKQELRFVGKLFVPLTSTPADIQADVKHMGGLKNGAIQFFEEIMSEPSVMCDPVDMAASFQYSQLQDGDIVCIQKALVNDVAGRLAYPKVPAYLEYVKNRQVAACVL